MEQKVFAGQDQSAHRNTEATSRILKNIQTYSIYIAAFLAPLFYLPLTPDPLFGKQVLVMILAAVALLAWLIRILITKEIKYHISVVTAAFGILLIVLFFASVFSLSPRQSFFAPDLSGERFASLAVFVIISFLIAAEFTRKHLERLTAVLLASGLILALLTFLHITPFFTLPEILQVNTVGTLNNSAAVILAFFLLGVGFLIFPTDESRYSKILAYLLTITAAVDLLLIDFKMGWLSLAVFSVLFIAFYSSRSMRRGEGATAKTLTYANLIFVAILGVSISLTIFTLPLAGILPGLKTEIEVMPSAQSTVSIGQEILKTKPILGSGPGTFVYDYGRFHSAAVNQTVFWNVKFVQGFSFLSTIISTLGTLGVLVFLFFIVALFYMLARISSRIERFGALEFGFAGIVVLGVILWAIYPATFVMNWLIFLAIGASLALAADMGESDAKSLFSRFERQILRIENQTPAFVASLSALAVVILALLAIFYSIEKYVAEIYFARGNFEFVQNGNADTALARYASALALDPKNDRYLVNQSQVYLSRAQQALNSALAGDSAAQTVFQTNLNSALESSRQATAADPYNSGNWINLGTVYEAAVPFVNGADNFATASYNEATKYDPVNPIPLTLLGRTGLEIADLIDIRARQNPALASNAKELKKTVLENAKQSLEKAVELKSDYAAAEFLLAQVFTREGNIDEALRRGTQAALSAPNDVGVAFFLGFLFYQKGDLVDAEQQFSRALLINPNYSNAMYFLGLIYDKTKRPGEALKQFRRINQLNPDNDEVKRIIANLEAGRPALATITPPPEKRKAPPIQESTQQKSRTTRTLR